MSPASSNNSSGAAGAKTTISKTVSRPQTQADELPPRPTSFSAAPSSSAKSPKPPATQAAVKPIESMTDTTLGPTNHPPEQLKPSSVLAKIPESHTGQPGKPNESAKPVAVESATAKAPPPPPRFKLPSVDDDDDDDFDNAPTTTFIHRVKYTYDPDAPPEDIELLDDDVDEQEPPTAIPTSPYRGEGTDSSDEPDVSSSTKDEPVPTSKQPAHPVSAPSRTASKPIRSPIAQSPQHAGAPLADPRLYETQQLRGTRFNARQGKQTNVGMVDPDAAPVWLKAIALSSVVSAITVLGVLGWMISKKF